MGKRRSRQQGPSPQPQHYGPGHIDLDSDVTLVSPSAQKTEHRFGGASEVVPSHPGFGAMALYESQHGLPQVHTQLAVLIDDALPMRADKEGNGALANERAREWLGQELKIEALIAGRCSSIKASLVEQQRDALKMMAALMDVNYIKPTVEDYRNRLAAAAAVTLDEEGAVPEDIAYSWENGH